MIEQNQLREKVLQIGTYISLQPPKVHRLELSALQTALKEVPYAEACLICGEEDTFKCCPNDRCSAKVCHDCLTELFTQGGSRGDCPSCFEQLAVENKLQDSPEVVEDRMVTDGQYAQELADSFLD